MASHTDIVVAITGASAGLGGLVLVFLGVLIAAYQSLVGPTPDKVLQKFKRAALWSLAVFGVSLANVIVDVSWLVAGGGRTFYLAALVIFFVQLGTVAAVAAYATVGVLLKG